MQSSQPSSQPLQQVNVGMSSSYGASIINENPNEDRDPPTKIDDIQIKNLKLFICFNSVVLGGAAVLVTMMMIGYNSVEYSKGRDFLLVASVITGIFMFLLVTFAILMLFTKSICISIVFFAVFTLYTAVHLVLAIVYVVFFFIESEWKTVNCLVVAFFFYIMGLAQCLFNGRDNQ